MVSLFALPSRWLSREARGLRRRCRVPLTPTHETWAARFGAAVFSTKPLTDGTLEGSSCIHLPPVLRSPLRPTCPEKRRRLAVGAGAPGLLLSTIVFFQFHLRRPFRFRPLEDSAIFLWPLLPWSWRKPCDGWSPPDVRPNTLTAPSLATLGLLPLLLHPLRPVPVGPNDHVEREFPRSNWRREVTKTPINGASSPRNRLGPSLARAPS